MPVRPFGKPTAYRLRVSYKVKIADLVEVKSALSAEAEDRNDIDIAYEAIAQQIERSEGYDAVAILVTVDQHGNTRQGEYVRSAVE